jgi:hypothetical protein
MELATGTGVWPPPEPPQQKTGLQKRW